MMAIEVVAHRLELGDVVLVSPPEQDEQVEAWVVRDIDRTESAWRPKQPEKELGPPLPRWPLSGYQR
jgi:hypothetical protein